VLEDVRDGFVSVEGAERDYGVMVRTPGARVADWHVDVEATERLRSDRRRTSDAPLAGASR
jgi:N-methylhydantoinase B